METPGTFRITSTAVESTSILTLLLRSTTDRLMMYLNILIYLNVFISFLLFYNGLYIKFIYVLYYFFYQLYVLFRFVLVWNAYYFFLLDVCNLTKRIYLYLNSCIYCIIVLSVFYFSFIGIGTILMCII